MHDWENAMNGSFNFLNSLFHLSSSFMTHDTHTHTHTHTQTARSLKSNRTAVDKGCVDDETQLGEMGVEVGVTLRSDAALIRLLAVTTVELIDDI